MMSLSSTRLLTSLSVFTYQPNALKILYRSWLLYFTSHKPHSSHHALQSLRQVQRRQHSHQVALKFDTRFAYHGRDLITMYIVTTIQQSPGLSGLRDLDAKDDSNFSETRLSYSISISLQGLGRPLNGKIQSRNTTTVFTSTCTLQAFSLIRCSP
jgi:hypothetical protein